MRRHPLRRLALLLSATAVSSAATATVALAAVPGASNSAVAGVCILQTRADFSSLGARTASAGRDLPQWRWPPSAPQVPPPAPPPVPPALPPGHGLEATQNALSLQQQARNARLLRVRVDVLAHWPLIFAVSCLVFAISFPLVHWYFKNIRDERDLFNHLRREDTHQSGFAGMLDYISIGGDGGFDKIKELVPEDCVPMERLVCMSAFIAILVFNTSILVWSNLKVMQGGVAYYRGEPADKLPLIMKEYMSFTSEHALVTVGHAAAVALAELLSVAVMVIVFTYRLGVFCACKASPAAQFDAFSALHGCFDLLHILTSFSALKLFSVVHPALIPRRFELHMAKPFFGHSRISQVAQGAWFTLTRAAAAATSVMAFGVKVAFVGVQLHLPLDSTARGARLLQVAWRWSLVVAFLGQTMGAMLVERLLRWRILMIIAGGDVTSQEVLMRRVYIARMTQVIYQEYWERGRRFAFAILMVTFDDRDLQRLLVDQDEGVKRRRLASFKKRLPTGALDLAALGAHGAG